MNRLIKLMPAEVRDELMLAGAEFRLKAGEAIPPESLEGSFVFVVEAGVASKFLQSGLGRYSEIAMVGPEGLFPVCALLQVSAAPHVVISQIGELSGRRIRSREFHGIVGQSDAARDLLHRYTYAFITQIASNILTSEQDPVETRLARWLLMCHDRIDGDDVAITHDTLAQMAFANRPTVTNMLNSIQEAGMIELSRGRISIRDRLGLRRLADSSYGLSEAYWRREIGPFGRESDAQDTIAA